MQINRVRLPATSVWFCLVFIFNTIFHFGLLRCFFILTADPADHALGSIYILSFYFAKGSSRALDLHTGQAYGQKRHVPPLKQLNFFQCQLTS